MSPNIKCFDPKEEETLLDVLGKRKDAERAHMLYRLMLVTGLRLSEALRKNIDSPKWKEGDFIGIKTVSNTKVGSVGQAFIESLCDALLIPYGFPEKELMKVMK